MPKQTKKQFDDLLDRATTQMKNNIAKREIIHFRLDEQSLRYLQELAIKRKKHVGALVRDWVLERISYEIDHSTDRSQNAPTAKTDIHFTVTQLQNDLKHMQEHIHKLKKCVS